jgi:NlpC/P60 family putative phage cell wall peptidase
MREGKGHSLTRESSHANGGQSHKSEKPLLPSPARGRGVGGEGAYDEEIPCFDDPSPCPLPQAGEGKRAYAIALPVNGGAKVAIARPHIVAAARDWLGTPYVHQASAKGQGTDCLGLVIGLYTELTGRAPEAPPPYTPDWNERRPCEEPLLSAARRHLVETARPFRPGQVLIFRVVATGPAKHCGVVSTPGQFIHAYAGRAVVESWLCRWWTDRVAGVFDFPGVGE